MMTYNDEMMLRFTPSWYQSINESWLAGANDALESLPLSKTKQNDYEWQEFIGEILVKSLEYNLPAIATMTHDDGPNSLLDRLGGHVSIAGRVTEDGLRFRFSESSQVLLSLVSGYGFEDEDDFVVAVEFLDCFLCMFPVRGPLEQELELILK